MKRISAEEISNAKSDAILSWVEGGTLTPRDVAQFVCSDECKQLMDEFVSQAQLDADRKEVKEIFEEIEKHQVVKSCGGFDFNVIEFLDTVLEILKQKHLGDKI